MLETTNILTGLVLAVVVAIFIIGMLLRLRPRVVTVICGEDEFQIKYFPMSFKRKNDEILLLSQTGFCILREGKKRGTWHCSSPDWVKALFSGNISSENLLSDVVKMNQIKKDYPKLYEMLKNFEIRKTYLDEK